MIDAIILAMFVLAPAAVFAQLPTRARRFFLSAAVAAFFAAIFLMGPALGGGRLQFLPLALLGIVIAGLIVEAVALVRRLLGTKGSKAAHG